MDKSIKKNRAAKAKAEEEALNSILYWVLGGLTLEFLLILLNRYWVNYRIAEFDFRSGILEPAVKILAFLSLAGVAVAAFWWKKGGMKERLPLAATLMSLGISAGCFSAWLVGEAGITVMYTVVPAIVLLAVIFYLYQREFFLIACISALGLLGIWLCSHGVSGRTGVVCWIYVLCTLAVLGATAWGFSLCQKDQGSLTWEGKKFRLLAKETVYPLLYGTAAIAAGVLVCALMGVPSMALYAVSVAWLLVMAVFYTVKLM